VLGDELGLGLCGRHGVSFFFFFFLLFSSGLLLCIGDTPFALPSLLDILEH
jgi:hypothetical protein